MSEEAQRIIAQVLALPRDEQILFTRSLVEHLIANHDGNDPEFIERMEARLEWLQGLEAESSAHPDAQRAP